MNTHSVLSRLCHSPIPRLVIFALVACAFVGCASITSPNPTERNSVVDRLDDQDALAKIATENMDDKVACAAAGRIQSLALLERVANERSPIEHEHVGVIIALRRLLYETGFSDRLGPVQILMSWKSFPRNYRWTKRGPDGFNKRVSVNIEQVTIVVLRKTTKIAEASWILSDSYAESWDSVTDIGTVPAPIAFCDLLPGLWNIGLGNGHNARPPSDHEMDALGGTAFDSGKVIAVKSADQGFLGWLYCENTDNNSKDGAVQHLTDQSVLAFTALNMTVASFEATSPIAHNLCGSEMNEHQSTIWVNKAWSKITDQELLTRIALNDVGASERSAAVQMLSDRTSLQKIADAATDDDVRKQAALRLKSLP